MTQKYKLMVALAIASTGFGYAFKVFEAVSLYWIVYGCLDLAFWITSWYPNYDWFEMGVFRRIAVCAVCVRFCLWFLPTDILLSREMVIVNSITVTVLLVGVLFDDGKGGGGGGKRRRKKKVVENPA